MEGESLNKQQDLDALERSEKFRGTILAPLSSLRFTTPRDYVNEKRLQGIFLNQSCRFLDPEHRISAEISEVDLCRILDSSNASVSNLLQNPQGIPPKVNILSDLKCFQGQSRVEAAKRILNLSEEFWAVDLYLDGITSSKGIEFIIVNQY